jgi:hypothetical protein
MTTSQIFSGRLSTGDNRFQKHLVYGFHKRNQICIISNVNYKDFLTRIFSLVGMFNNIQKLTLVDVKNDLFKGNPSFNFKSCILFIIPGKEFHVNILTQRVPFGNA